MSEAALPLPAGQMPPCWSDDVRMTVLFAPFRLKAVNPTDYESKMKFWTEMISKWCQSRGSFCYDEIRSAFQRNGKYPACLEIVMEQMIKDGVLRPRSSIQPNPQGWVGWGLGQVLRPAAWAAGTLLGSKGMPSKQTRYVHAEALKTQSLAFLSSLPDEAKIGSAQELWAASKTFSSRTEVGDALELILDWLRSQNLAICSKDGRLFKLSLDAETCVKPFTEGEVCLPRLEKALRSLQGSIDKLKENSSSARISAKSCLARGDRVAAMGHLRQKKLLEIRLEKALNSQDSITHLIDTVRQAHSDSEIFDAFKTGLGALKITMKQTGLEEDNVMDTMDDIKESLDVYSDIEAAIAQPIGMTFDKDELEAELRELLATEEVGDGGAGGGGAKGNISVEDEDMFPDLPKVPEIPLDTKLGVKRNIPEATAKMATKQDESEEFHRNMERRLKNLRLVENS